MAYTEVKFAAKLFTLVKNKNTFMPGKFADAFKNLLDTTYPQVIKNFTILEKEVGASFAKVTGHRDLIKKVAAGEMAKPNPNPNAINNLQNGPLKAMATEIEKAATSQKDCHKALEGVMTNLEAQLQQSVVNDASKAEAAKAVRFLAAIEPRLMTQLERVKEMEQFQKQCEMVVEAAERKAAGASGKTEGELDKSLDELKGLYETVTKKSNHILSQYIGPLEVAEKNYANYVGEPKRIAAEMDKKKQNDLKKAFLLKIDQLLKKVKRSYADGESSLNAFDESVNTLKVKIGLINTAIGNDRRLAARRGEANKYGPMCAKVAGDVYTKTAKHLDVQFLRDCMKKHKAMSDEIAKIK